MPIYVAPARAPRERIVRAGVAASESASHAVYTGTTRDTFDYDAEARVHAVYTAMFGVARFGRLFRVCRVRPIASVIVLGFEWDIEADGDFLTRVVSFCATRGGRLPFFFWRETDW